jgi:hypothetical protein
VLYSPPLTVRSLSPQSLPLPRWARLADAASLALVCLAAGIASFGGLHTHVAHVRVSIGTPWRPLLLALSLIAIRHAFVRRHPLHRRLGRGCQALGRWMVSHPSGSRWARAGAILCLATTVLFAASVARYYHRDTGLTSLIGFGKMFARGKLAAVRAVPHYVYDGGGYDGQFYAQLAVDPLLRQPVFLDRALDKAPYRSRRILFAWSAYLLGLGRTAWILQAYAAQNIVAWFLLAWLLLRWLPSTRLRNFLPWFGCLFGGGLIGSVRMSLLEGPSLLVLVLAIAAVESRRRWLGTALMALAGLGRETNLLGSGLLADRVPRNWRQGLTLARTLLVVVTPYVLWSLYVRSRWSWFAFSNPASFSVPFSAYVAKWAVMWSDLRAGGWTSLARFDLAVLVSLTVQAGFLLARLQWRDAWWRMGAAYGLFLPFLSAAVWEGSPGAVVRVLLPMTFAFNVLVVRSRWFWPLAILGNLSVLHGLWLLEVPGLSRYL